MPASCADEAVNHMWRYGAALRITPPHAGTPVPRHVALYSPEDRILVLSVRPGITDRASVEFKDESEILSAAFDPELAYRTVLLPKKLAYYRAYVRERSFGGVVAIIFATVMALLSRDS